MRNRTRHMRQDATYWGPPTRDGLGGLTFPAPVAIKVRWQQKAETFTDAQGDERVSSAIVYPAQPLETEGWLYLGTTADADPRPIAYEIKQSGFSPNLRATEQLNKVWL